MRQLLDDFYVSSPFKLAMTAFNFNLYRAWHSEMHVVELSARPAWLQRHFISLSRACFECRWVRTDWSGFACSNTSSYDKNLWQQLQSKVKIVTRAREKGRVLAGNAWMQSRHFPPRPAVVICIREVGYKDKGQQQVREKSGSPTLLLVPNANK